jgi:hypothetical protein
MTLQHTEQGQGDEGAAMTLQHTEQGQGDEGAATVLQHTEQGKGTRQSNWRAHWRGALEEPEPLKEKRGDR